MNLEEKQADVDTIRTLVQQADSDLKSAETCETVEDFKANIREAIGRPAVRARRTQGRLTHLTSRARALLPLVLLSGYWSLLTLSFGEKFWTQKIEQSLTAPLSKSARACSRSYVRAENLTRFRYALPSPRLTCWRCLRN